MQNNARDMYRGLLIFQTMFNITRTGKIDEETIMQMSKPRCGNKDFDLHFNSLKFSDLNPPNSCIYYFVILNGADSKPFPTLELNIYEKSI